MIRASACRWRQAHRGRLGVDLRRLTTLARFPGQHASSSELSCLRETSSVLDHDQRVGHPVAAILRLHRVRSDRRLGFSSAIAPTLRAAAEADTRDLH